jgi:DNA-binding transcriptional regulator YhcF (GntR family)
MPAPLVKSLAKKYHKSPKTVDKKFKRLKKGIVDSGKGGYGLVVSQLKKGLKKEETQVPYKRLFDGK